MGQPINSNIEYSKYLSNEIKGIFSSIREELVDEFGITFIDENVFFYYTLSNEDCLLYKAINGFLNTFDITDLQRYFQELLQKSEYSGIKHANLELTSEFKSLLVRANSERILRGHKLITTDHVLLAYITLHSNNTPFTEKGLNYERMNDLSNKIHEITNSLNENIDNPSTTQLPGVIRIVKNVVGIGDMSNHINFSTKKESVPFCTNLNATINEKIIGRDKEIEHILKIISRKKCNNAVLVGKSGIGKTSIVYRLINIINSPSCPSFLTGMTVYKLNPSEIIAGTQLRGMFEDKMNGLINALNKHHNMILFIDDFHYYLTDKQKEDNNFVAFLNDIFKNGKIKVIATTTEEGYKNGFENHELDKLFQKVNVEEPTNEECFNILKGAKNDYEAYHKVTYTDNAIKLCGELSKRYITEKSIPLSAFDILDEAGTNAKLNALNNVHIVALKEEIEKLRKEKELCIVKDKTIDADNLQNKINNLSIMLSQHMDEFEKTRAIVDENEVYQAISEHTNIPISKLNASEIKIVFNIDKVLKSVVIGQDEAIDEIAKVIKRNKVGLSNENRPIGSFMYLGNSGVGKTLTAKELAKEIFGDEKYLVRFDMSEYADKTAVNKLIGASSGYIGYDKGGLLTEAVKRNKYCVLLIDEIEKADEEIYNLFLQVLDEGMLTDNTGRKVDFKNTIIIFTSNIGAKLASQTKAFGFNSNSSFNKKSVVEKEMKKKFPPEFINRLDKVIYFNSLTDENLKDIISMELKKTWKKMKKIGYGFDWKKGVVDYLFNLCKDEREYGARPIVRIIQREIENQITDKLLENEMFPQGHSFVCEILDGNLRVW